LLISTGSTGSIRPSISSATRQADLTEALALAAEAKRRGFWIMVGGAIGMIWPSADHPHQGLC
jgi:hypothetical protein